jgi:DNA invertase Pin-like site-specific DNA recombinase
MRAAIYLRVSTAEQTTDNQERELRAAAERMGHEVVEVYRDHAISGSKGRDRRPAFDRLHQDATRRRFDLVMAWSVDRLGRSLQDLVGFLEHLRETRCELFLHQQGLDTTTSSGRAMFGMLSVFAEFERSIIRERVVAGMSRARAKGTRSGRAIGRPAIARHKRAAIREAYTAGKVGLRGLPSGSAWGSRRCGAAWPRGRWHERSGLVLFDRRRRRHPPHGPLRERRRHDRRRARHGAAG